MENNMSAKNTTETIEQEKIVDDVSGEKISENLDVAKLEKLKAKLASKNKETEMGIKNLVKPEKSIRFGCIGLGQAGSKLIAACYKRGMDAVAINTTYTDLKYVDIPDRNKLIIGENFQGAAKERSLGKSAAEDKAEDIFNLVNTQLADSQMFLVASSLGGGSGSGMSPTVVEILQSFGKPVIFLAVLPLNSDDLKSKKNTLDALDELTKLTQQNKISSLIIADNARIESLEEFGKLGPFKFFDAANEAIIDVLDRVNFWSAQGSNFKSYDSTEFIRTIVDGNALLTMAKITVDNYQEDTSLAEAIMSGLHSNLLASDFDLKTCKYFSAIFVASKSVWDKVSANAVNYCMHVISEETSNSLATFKGLYVDEEDTEDNLKIYVIASGLSLPTKRIENLEEETKKFNEILKEKEVQRNASFNFKKSSNSTINSAEAVKEKIANKSSSFAKFINNVDKRK